MTMKKIVLIAHDPGGLDAIFPLYSKLSSNQGLTAIFFCIGPSAAIEPQFAASSELALSFIRRNVKQIALLVTGTSWGDRTEVQAIELCKKAGVRTMSILDYWSNYSSRFYSETSNEFHYPDFYVVMDRLAEQEAKADGVPKEIIHPLGHPGLDKYVQARQEMKPKHVISKRALLLSQPISKLYGNAFGYTEYSVIEDVLHLFDYKDWTLKIKFHPKDDLALIDKYGERAVSGSLLDILPNFDVVIGMNTIALLHAIILGIPVISYQPSLARDKDICITNKLGLTEPVVTLNQLKQKLCKLNNGVRINAKPVNNFLWSDGTSTERICNFILEVTNSYVD